MSSHWGIAVSDHVGNFNAVQRCGRGCEGFDPAHVPYATLDEPMILLDQVAQKLGSDCLDFG
ncbi:hypothetical protein RKLH11_3753 [Rhodobacteraceae bacterium KLH11]|nr:hypothetical protein RKLH11_3753 [Rhodobacteraceae bacterium KLH11]